MEATTKFFLQLDLLKLMLFPNIRYKKIILLSNYLNVLTTISLREKCH